MMVLMMLLLILILLRSRFRIRKNNRNNICNSTLSYNLTSTVKLHKTSVFFEQAFFSKLLHLKIVQERRITKVFQP